MVLRSGTERHVVPSSVGALLQLVHAPNLSLDLTSLQSGAEEEVRLTWAIFSWCAAQEAAWKLQGDVVLGDVGPCLAPG